MNVLSSTVLVLILLFAVFLFIKLITKPIRLVFRLLLNALLGFVLLFVINFFVGFFNIAVELNWFNAVITGIFGIPGYIVLLVIQWLGL